MILLENIELVLIITELYYNYYSTVIIELYKQ